MKNNIKLKGLLVLLLLTIPFTFFKGDAPDSSKNIDFEVSTVAVKADTINNSRRLYFNSNGQLITNYSSDISELNRALQQSSTKHTELTAQLPFDDQAAKEELSEEERMKLEAHIEKLSLEAAELERKLKEYANNKPYNIPVNE